MISLAIEGLDVLDRLFQSLPNQIDSGVKSTGPGSEYSLVWEWGSARLTQPGPKTTWGVNPDGDPAILTITAPYGYIRINRDKYLAYIEEQIQQIEFNELSIDKWKEAIDQAMLKAAENCAELISASAPIDRGDLQQSIQPVAPGDSILQTGDSDELGVIL